MQHRAALAVFVLLASAGSAFAAEDIRTGYIPLPPGSGNVHEAEPPSRILFLNRCKDGCTLSPSGSDDSRSNKSSIVPSTTTISPFPYGDDSWRRVVDCVKSMYRDFDMEITDQDPGSTPHYEAIVAGRPTDLGMNPNVGGVAPFACGVIDNAITFTFAEMLGNSPQRICEVIAQESAHGFGLDHVLLCEDPMTYTSGCGTKCFQNTASDCGEQNARRCYCGGREQNSWQRLADLFGTVESSSSIRFNSPAAGEQVISGFHIRVEPQVNCLRLVEAWAETGDQIIPLGTIYTWPFVFDTPPDLPLGPVTIRVQSTDAAGETISDTIEVIVSESLPTPDAGVDPCSGGCPDAGTGNPGDGDESGGCRSSDHGGSWALILLGLVCAIRLRRVEGGRAARQP